MTEYQQYYFKYPGNGSGTLPTCAQDTRCVSVLSYSFQGNTNKEGNTFLSVRALTFDLMVNKVTVQFDIDHEARVHRTDTGAPLLPDAPKFV